MDQPDLRSAEHYINREWSLLGFNERVLAQALDERVPLLERLKRKYGPGLSDVVAMRDRLTAEADALDAGEGRVVDLERNLASSAARYLEAAGALSSARRRVADAKHRPNSPSTARGPSCPSPTNGPSKASPVSSSTRTT